MKLKSKRMALLAIIFLVFAGMLILSIILSEVLYFQERAQKVAMSNALNKATEREALVNTMLFDVETSLLTLRDNAYFTAYFNDEIPLSSLQQFLISYTELYPNVMSFKLLDAAGNEQIVIKKDTQSQNVSFLTGEQLENIADHQDYRRATDHASDSVLFSPIHLETDSDSIDGLYKPVMDASLPVGDGGFIMVSYVMNQFLETLINTPLYEMIAFNDDGYVLYHYSGDDDKNWGNSLSHQYHISDAFPSDYEALLTLQTIETESFVSKHLDTPISGGLNLVLQLKSSYVMAEQKRTQNEYVTKAIMILTFSIILTYLIIRIFSKTLLNFDRIQALNQALNHATSIAKIGFWEIDSKSLSISWNEGIHPLFELDDSSSIMSYETFLGFIANEDRERFRTEVRASIADHSDFYTKHQIITAKGNIKYVECRGKHYYDKSNHHIKSIGSLYDITEAYFSELKFRSLLNLASDGIHILDNNGNLIEFSYSFAKNLGYSVEEVANLTVWDWDASIAKDELLDAIHELIKEPSTFETKHRRKDGTVIDVQINAKGIEINGETYLYASQRDISDIKEKERLLLAKTSEQRALLSLFDIGDSVLFRWENKTPRNLVYVSKNVAGLLGYSTEAFLSGEVRYRSCIHPDDLQRVIDEIETAKSQNAVFIDHKAYRLITKSGDVKWVYDQTVIERNDAGVITHIIGYIMDITNEKHYEQSLEEKQTELQTVNHELEKSMSDLRATMLLYEAEKTKYKTILELASDGVFFMDINGNLIDFSKRAVELLGYTNQEMAELSVFDWDKNINKDQWNELYQGLFNQPLDIERIHTRKDGSNYIAHITARRISIDNLDYVYASVRDVTIAKETQKAFEDSKLRWQFAVEGNKDGLWDWNIDLNEVFLSTQWKHLMGYSEEEFPCDVEAWKAIVVEEDFPGIDRNMQRYLKGLTDSYVSEHRIKHKDGRILWIRDRGIVVEKNEDNSPHRVIGTSTDITEYINALELIKKQTYIDELTQLQNRKSYNERLDELMEQFHRYGITFSMMMLDIDHFKSINDHFGHSMGDEVLKSVSSVITRNIRKNDYAFRIGGEEFVILATNTSLDNAAYIAEKLRATVVSDVDLLQNDNRQVTISIGVIQVQDTDNPDTIFTRADQAMYEAKSKGRNQVVTH